MGPTWILWLFVVVNSAFLLWHSAEWYRSEPEDREEPRNRWINSAIMLMFFALLLQADAEIESRDELIEDQQELLEEQSARSSKLEDRTDNQLARVDSLHREVVSLKSRADNLCSFNLTASD